MTLKSLNKNLIKAGNQIERFFENSSLFFWGALGFFTIAKEVYYLAVVPIGAPPDEAYHIQLSQIYFSSWRIWPSANIGNIGMGVINGVPNLYHQLMGFLLRLNVSGISDAIYLRIINLVIYIFAIYIFYRLASRILKSQLAQYISVLIFTNIMMLSVMAVAVSYDNLQLMFSLLSMLILVRLGQNFSIKKVLWLSIILSLGMLTKFTFLPFGFIAALICLILIFINKDYIYSRVRVFLKEFLSKKINAFKQTAHFKAIGLAITTIVLLLGIFLVYGLNAYLYKSILPKCDDFFTSTECYQNSALYKREQDLKESLEKQRKAGNLERIGFIAYSKHWAKSMLNGIFGFVGHVALSKPASYLYAYLAVVLMAGILTAVKYKEFLTDKRLYLLLTVSVFYTLVLFFYQNYRTYLETGSLSAALQGRYLFPVIGPLIILTVWPYSKLPKWLEIVTYICIAIFFLFGDLVYFYLHRSLIKIT